MESVAQGIVTNAVQLLNAEYQQLRGVGVKAVELSNDLAAMDAVLRMLSESDEGAVDHLVGEWEKQLRELAYDARDCIDLYKLRIKSSPNGGVSARMRHLVSTLFARRQLAGEIDALRARATAISERHARYAVFHTPRAPMIAKRYSPEGHAVSYGISEHLMANRQLIHTLNPVGVEEDMKKLQTWMEKEDKHSDQAVLSIVGFGGVGKSTIATALYRDFSNEFDCRASITVSQIYDEDEVLRDILGQMPWDRDQEQQDTNTRRPEKNQASGMKAFVQRVVPLPCGQRKRRNDGSTHWTQNTIEASMTRGQLIQELHWRLNGKRYILLLDDIWSVETWENIRDWLPPEKGSKVIVTSRFQAVGAVCSGRDGIDHLHTVYPLRYDMSESLFKHAVSDHLHSSRPVCDPQSRNGSEEEKVHAEIWKYCGGLPLTIVTVAGLVACNPTEDNDHWSRVCESVFLGQAAPLTLDGVARITYFCYSSLPSDLKTCLLYLSIFPKGSKISKKRLTKRWISDRFITERYGLSAEEVAEMFFDELIRRKIIRPEDHSSNGKVKSFKVHDMILEHIVYKSIEENFITIVGGHWMIPNPSNKARRLSIKSSGHKHGNSIKGMNLSHVRSLTVFGSQNRRFPFHSFNNGIIQELDLEGWKGMTDKYLNDIFEMLALKYLSLRRTEVVKIPSKIGKLEYLETLDIRETRVEVFPRAFGKLKRLRSMLGGSKNPKKALKLTLEKNKEPMKALEVLSGIEINMDSAAVASLHQMTGLKKLAIYKLKIQEGDDGKLFKQLRSAIEYLCNCGLQALAINDEYSGFIDSLDSMSSPPRQLVGLQLSGKMEKPPKWIKYLSNLYKLTISVTILRTDTFKLISGLPKLFSLTFTLTAEKDDPDTVDILEENKLLTDRQIIVPPGGFSSLKLLRFFATLVPRLSFAVTEQEVMPVLERIDMRFQAFEGIYGIETLKNLRELHLSVGNQADEVTKFLVEELKDRPKYLDEKYARMWPKIISD